MPSRNKVFFILASLLLFSATAFTAEVKKYEKDYQNEWCAGETEVVLHDRTRIDCVTQTHAIEIDWCNKWAEGVGQSLYYAKVTGKKPGLALICSEDETSRYPSRAKLAAPEIDIFIIKKEL